MITNVLPPVYGSQCILSSSRASFFFPQYLSITSSSSMAERPRERCQILAFNVSAQGCPTFQLEIKLCRLPRKFFNFLNENGVF